jgi:hypothetical protein
MTEGGELDDNDPWRLLVAFGALPQNTSAYDIEGENNG